MGTQLCTHTYSNAYIQLLAGTSDVVLRFCSVSVVALLHHVRCKRFEELTARLRALICNEL
jgi:hypothetical protein